jgi:hypothetical protein
VVMIERGDTRSIGVFNGYPIRVVKTRFGELFHIDGLDVAYPSQSQAIRHAQAQPSGDRLVKGQEGNGASKLHR